MKYIKILILFVLGVLTNYYYIVESDHKQIINLSDILIRVSIIVGLIILFLDIRSFRKQKHFSEFFPSVMGILFIGVFLIISFQLKQRDQSPVQMSIIGSYKKKAVVNIDFREDGTYKLTDWEIIKTDIYRGKYIRKDSLIFMMLPKDSQSFMKSSKLVIAKDTLYQVDNNYQIIKGAETFKILKNIHMKRNNI